MVRANERGPRLSPRLRPRQLWAMANDPDWRPWMRLVVSHPHAWEGLRDWHARAIRLGYERAGVPPRPPEDRSGLWFLRPAIPVAPLPPEDDGIPTGRTVMETSDGADCERDEDPAEQAVSASAEHPRRRVGLRTIVLIVAVPVVLATVAFGVTALGLSQARHRAEAAARAAVVSCTEARSAATRQERVLARTIGEARALLDATGEDAVADTGVLSELRADLAQPVMPSVSCRARASADANRRAAGTWNRAAAKWKRQAADVKTGMRRVKESELDKTVADAGALLKDSDGRVQDDATRKALSSAIGRRNAKAIALASRRVRDSMQARTEADAKARAEAEAAAQAQSTPQAPTTARSGSAASAPASSGGQSSQSSGQGASDGWDVPAPAPTDTDAGLGRDDPSL